MKELSFETIFSMFLKALKFDAPITRSPNGLKAKRGNALFHLIKSSKTIVLKEYGTVFNGSEYEKVEKAYLYKIIEDMGDIKISDENKRVVLHLKSDHQILKIESANKKPINNKQFIGSADLLKYKEVQQQQASLF